MSLTTTMGIELSYVPQAIQTAFNRGATFPTQDALGERDLINGLAKLLRHMVKTKNIPTYYEVHTDPGCVEVATKPYSKLSTLLSVARRIGREAEALGLTPSADYTGGGGAHIHTGVLGDTHAEREAYKRRMLLFAAMNPWMAWACINVVDDINAGPITRSELLGIREDDWEGDDLRDNVRRTRRLVLQYTQAAHGMDTFRREHYTPRLHSASRKYMQARVRLLRHEKLMKAQRGNVSTTAELSNIAGACSKDKCVRVTGYGQHGTIEFRVFEMGDEAKLRRNIFLANAVCQYVERWGITKFNISDVPTATQLWNMSWREARTGWLRMLGLLGLDPAEYREETANIARRWRHWRAENGNPAGIDTPQELRSAEQADTRDLSSVQRAVLRHQRREGRVALRQARSALRQATAASAHAPTRLGALLREYAARAGL